MNKYRDLFTEPIDFHVTRELLQNIPIDIDKNILNKMATPLQIPLIEEDVYDVLLLIRNAGRTGRDHLLFDSWIKQFNNANILIPHFIGGDNMRISYKIILSSSEDSETVANENVKKENNFKPLLHDSIISTTNNKHWREQRMDLINAFSVTSLSNVLNISANRAEKCSSILNNLKQPVNMAEFFLNETMAQLLLSMFGTSDKFQEDNNKIIRNGLGGFETPGKIRESAFKLLYEANKLTGPLSKVLNNRTPYTDTEKYGNALIFMFAGHDTTGLTLTWLLYEISKNQSLQLRLQKEVDEFWREVKDKDITFNDLKKLKFMTRCVMETLRLWPAVANGTFRKLDTDIEIKGKHNKSVLIPKNNIVQIFNWSKHRDKKIWGEDAEIFNPDREFNSNEIWEDNGFAFFNPATPRFSPFTYSPRDCIGKNFAQMEMRLILCNLLKDYHFILTKEQMEYNVLTNSMNNATLAPKDIYNTEKLTNKFRPYNVGMYFYFTHRKSKL